MTSGDKEIVWPEHLFDGDHHSVDEDAVSQTSQGSDGIGIRRTSHKTARSSTPQDLSYPAETSTAREYWDHDTRDYASNRCVKGIAVEICVTVSFMHLLLLLRQTSSCA